MVGGTILEVAGADEISMYTHDQASRRWFYFKIRMIL